MLHACTRKLLINLYLKTKRCPTFYIQRWFCNVRRVQMLVLLPCSGSTIFSTCSGQDFEALVLRGGGECLKNQPSPSDVFGAAVCGNGRLDEGEQCDCGKPEVEKKNFSLSLLSIWTTLYNSIFLSALHVSLQTCWSLIKNSQAVLNSSTFFEVLTTDFLCFDFMQECDNDCCDASTCKFKSGATCAQGSCCDNCQVSM